MITDDDIANDDICNIIISIYVCNIIIAIYNKLF